MNRSTPTDPWKVECPAGKEVMFSVERPHKADMMCLIGVDPKPMRDLNYSSSLLCLILGVYN